MRTYGTIHYTASKNWLVDAEPHVNLRLKDMFRQVQKGKTKGLSIASTPQACKDLEWFMTRYPLVISDKDLAALQAGRSSYDTRQEELERILLPDYVPNPVRLAKPLRPYQLTLVDLFKASGSLLCGDEVGLGKAQPNTAKVLTPHGWKLMGDIRVGDLVMNDSGLPTRVLGVFPQGKIQTYQVIFSDGSSTECCNEHLWDVQTDNWHLRDPERWDALPLCEISANLNVNKPGGAMSRFRIPITKAIVGDSAVLPMNPYLLGILLGDGSFRSAVIYFTSADMEEMLARAKVFPGYGWTLRIKDKNCETRSLVRVSSKGRENVNFYKQYFKQEKLWGKMAHEKHIPDVFLRASAEDRLALLQGLVDTDGYIGKDGVCQFTTTSSRLIEEVRELIWSLGGIARLSSKIPTFTYKGIKKNGRRAYTITINLPDGLLPVSIKRKVDRLTSTRKYYPTRKIKQIVPSKIAESTCIKVEAKNQRYITDDYIVTHNTAQAIGCIVASHRSTPALVVCQSHLTAQWAGAINEFAPDLRVHVIKTRKPYSLPEADVYVSTYSRIIGWDDINRTGYFKMIVYDECQELRRQDTAKYGSAEILTEKASYVLGLSATPVYNFGGEIFAVMNVINPGCLGRRDEFVREWCTEGFDDKLKVKEPAALGSYLRENYLMLRRTRKDVGRELPPVNKIVHEVEYNTTYAKTFEKDLKAIAAKVVGGSFVERGQAARELDAIARMMTGVAKSEAVADYVKVLLENGEKVLLVGWHREVYDRWLEQLAEYKPVLYTGSESPAAKQKSRDAFISGESPLMIMSLRSGVGLDGLQESCNIVVFGELDWSPAVHHQVIGRLRRDGQDTQVTAIYLTTSNGTDPLMIDLLGLKASQASGIVDKEEEILTVSDDSRIKQLAQQLLER